MSKKLPTGWTFTTLRTCVDVLDGKRVPINSDERAQRIAGKSNDALFPYFGATGQVGLIDGYIFDEPLILLGEDGVPFFDPLRHKAYLVDGKVWVNNHAHVLRANSVIADRRFLCAYLNVADYTGVVSGSTRLKLTQAAMNMLPVPLPPLSEQRRIADKLDTLLVRIDACRERLDQVPGVIKRFRQAVLEAAVSGSLTTEWRLENGVPDVASWVQYQLSQCVSPRRVITYGVIKLGDEIEDGTPCLRTSNVRWLRFELEGLKRIAPELSASYARTVLSGGEVLVNVRGTLGGVAVVPAEMKGWNVSREVAVLPVDPSIIDAEFASLWIAAGRSQQWLKRVEKGNAYTGINIEDLKTLPIAVPTLQEQREIVFRVDKFFALADALEARLQAAQAAVDRLTPATLSKAFRGELVPQDPADEPAQALLERLKSEPAAAPVRRGRRVATAESAA